MNLSIRYVLFSDKLLLQFDYLIMGQPPTCSEGAGQLIGRTLPFTSDETVKQKQLMTEMSTAVAPAMSAGGIPSLVDLLRMRSSDNDHPLRRLHAVVAAVLCNVSHHQLIRRSLAAAGASTVLVQLLSADGDTACADDVDVASRAAVVIADVADSGDDERRIIADCGGVQALVRLLDSNLEDVLANAMNALRVLCSGDVPDIRSAVGATEEAVPALVEFLSVPSGQLCFSCDLHVREILPISF